MIIHTNGFQRYTIIVGVTQSETTRVFRRNQVKGRFLINSPLFPHFYCLCLAFYSLKRCIATPAYYHHLRNLLCLQIAIRFLGI